jgi:hypothetical protein
MTTTKRDASDERIAELEAALRDHDRRIAQLENELAQRQRPVGGAGIDVRELPSATFITPSETELRMLYNICCKTAPRLAPERPEDCREHFEGFRTAFGYLATLSRTDTLDTSRMTSWWCDAAEQWSREHGRTATVRTPSFTVAALSHGDIGHSFTAERYPHDLFFGIALGGSKPATDKWRRLQIGLWLAATPIATPQPQQFRHY